MPCLWCWPPCAPEAAQGDWGLCFARTYYPIRRAVQGAYLSISVFVYSLFSLSVGLTSECLKVVLFLLGLVSFVQHATMRYSLDV